jgi:hypothetical protein
MHEIYDVISGRLRGVGDVTSGAVVSGRLRNPRLRRNREVEQPGVVESGNGSGVKVIKLYFFVTDDEA